MPNDRWEVPDIAGMLGERPVESAPAIGSMEPGFPSLAPTSEIPGDYVIDPDYSELMRFDFENPYGYRK